MIVLKIGGGKSIDFETVSANVAALNEQLVIVHGANAELNELSTALNHPPQTVQSPSGHSSRRTDQQTMNHFLMAYCGKANKRLVEALQGKGVNAVGLSGVDGGLLRGKRKQAIKSVENGKVKVIRDDYSGKITEVNTELLTTLLKAGYTPVISPPALSEENEAINVDGDRAAAEIAKALGADTLVILTDVPGLLTDPKDETSLLQKTTVEQAEQYAQGRMKKKVLAAHEALSGGVSKVIFSDARVEAPINAALNGGGTTIE